MRFAFVVALLAFPALSGCGSAPASLASYFPPADLLPEGVEPIPTTDAAYIAANETLRMDGNPGRVGLLDSVNQGKFSNVTDLHLWLLRDLRNSATGFAVVVTQFRTLDDADAATGATGSTKACRGDQVAHALRDGRVFILVTASGQDDEGRHASVVDAIAATIQSRSGADRIC